MSGRLVSAVLESALDGWLKLYACGFATFAADDGSRVYPTIGRVARLVSRSERQTQKATSALRRLGVLEALAPSGRNTATRYHFHVERLPQLGDAQQVFLFDVLTFPQVQPGKRSGNTRFPQFPQPLTGTPRHPRGELHDTRSVSRSVNYSTYTRETKTGTGTGE